MFRIELVRLMFRIMLVFRFLCSFWISGVSFILGVCVVLVVFWFIMLVLVCLMILLKLICCDLVWGCLNENEVMILMDMLVLLVDVVMLYFSVLKCWCIFVVSFGLDWNLMYSDWF